MHKGEFLQFFFLNLHPSLANVVRDSTSVDTGMADVSLTDSKSTDSSLFQQFGPDTEKYKKQNMTWHENSGLLKACRQRR